MDKPYFIVNPVSGAGRAAAMFEQVRAELDAAQIEYGFDYTTAPNHATELAKAALSSGCKLIAAVGGDGTTNEVAAAVIGTDAVLAVLPFGTGNDFSKVVPVAKDVEGVVETFKNGIVKNADAGQVNGRPFINIAGFGFDVDVLRAADQYKKRFNGLMPYLLGIIKALSHLKAMELCIEHDGEIKVVNAMIFTVGNGQYFGGGMRAVPMASPFDGYFDICYVDKINKLSFLTLLPGFMKGKHFKHTNIVHHIHTKEISVKCTGKYTLELDGELDLSTPARFKVLPGALKLLLPADTEVK